MNPDNPQSGSKRGSDEMSRNAAGTSSGFDPLAPSNAGDLNTTDSGAAIGSGASAGGTTYGSGTAAGSTAGTGTAGQQGSGMFDQVKDRAASQLDAQKARATEGLGSVAQAVRQTTQQLRDEQHDTVAQFVERAADQIERFSNHLRDRNVNDLVKEAQQFARRQPAVFIGSSFAAGLLAARFIKASRPDTHDTGYGRTGHGSQGTQKGAGTDTGYGAGPSYGTGPNYGTGSSYGTGTTSGTGGIGADRPGSFGSSSATGDASSFNTSDRPGSDPTGRGSF